MSANKENLIYLTYLLIDEPILFLRSNEDKIKDKKREASKLKLMIVNPKVNKSDLDERQETLRSMTHSFLYAGTILTALLTMLTGLMTQIAPNNTLTSLIISFGVYFNGVALAFSWRTSIAGFDYLRFKKLKDKEEIKNFKINKLAEPKLYDFAIALIPTIAFYHLMIYTVNM